MSFNLNKKKLCCCLSVIRQNAAAAKVDGTKYADVVSAAATGVVDVMLITDQKQSVWDSCFALFLFVAEELKAKKPDCFAIADKLNTFANSIPLS